MTELIVRKPWASLRAAARKCKQPALIAVAYFGKGASKLLKLKEGSRIVVDASKHAVSAGQTHPADLKVLVKKGVKVYSVPNLHAKMYLFGNQAFIGSANASNHSNKVLIEVLLATNDRRVIADAKRFILDHCTNELGPKELDRLQKEYRPPNLSGKREKQPKVFIEHLERHFPPKGSESAQKAGTRRACTKMQHPRLHVLEDFWSERNGNYQLGDKIVQIIEENGSVEYVSPPGSLVSVTDWTDNKASCYFYYLELPRKRRVKLDILTKRLGYGSKKHLLKNGKVKVAFAKKLLKYWAEKGSG